MKTIEKTSRMSAQEAKERFKELLSYHPTHRKAYEENGIDGPYAIGDIVACQLIELLELMES